MENKMKKELEKECTDRTAEVGEIADSELDQVSGGFLQKVEGRVTSKAREDNQVTVNQVTVKK